MRNHHIAAPSQPKAPRGIITDSETVRSETAIDASRAIGEKMSRTPANDQEDLHGACLPARSLFSPLRRDPVTMSARKGVFLPLALCGRVRVVFCLACY